MSKIEKKIDANTPHLILVSGMSGAGKTTWCRAQVLQAREQGLTVGGLLSPGVYQQGAKVGIELLDLARNEKRPLGELRPEIVDAPTRKWAMNAQTLAWGNHVLQAMGYYDLVVIDELGPLEFLYQQGLMQAFNLIERRQYQTALVVVRPTLLEAAKRNWCDFDLRVHLLGE
jgi:nucleoside-triphosphatase THEP1